MPSFDVTIDLNISDIMAVLDDEDIVDAYNELGLTPEFDVHRDTQALLAISEYLRMSGRLDLAAKADDILAEIRGQP